jgi:predicted acetyltransferase
VDIQVRPCDPEELAAGATPIFHFFGRTPDEQWLQRAQRVLEPGRLHAAFVDGRAVGGAGAFTFQLTVPGGRVAAAGITMVGVLPTHRRRGVLTRMMRAQLDDVRRRGEPVAYLFASEGAIYRRYGYGLASLMGTIEFARRHGEFHTPFEPRGVPRLVAKEEAIELLPPIYEQVAVETPGMFSRSRTWWEDRVLLDPEWRRDGGGEQQHVVLDVDGEPQAYALYRVHPSWEYSASTGLTNVTEAMGVTPAATREIWRYLLDVDWMERLRAWLLPVDHPLLLLLTEPRRMRFTLQEGLWVRLVDVAAALGARSYAEGDPVTLEVADSFCPWNEGRWRIGDGVKRVDAEPELRLDVTALGSVYLGGFTFAELARGLMVEELVPGAITRADALFRTDRAPWCPEIF